MISFIREKKAAFIIILIAVAAIIAGAALGEPGTVLQKAVRICLECIGIG